MTTHKRLPLKAELLGILLHALGVQKRAGRWSVGGWRNYYNTNSHADSLVDCKVLAACGWMAGHRSLGIDREEWTFRVTEAGIAALRLAGWKIEVSK